MYLMVNLDDPADLRRGQEEIHRRLQPSGDVTAQYVKDVWTRIGLRMRQLVEPVLASGDEYLTVHGLAKVLDRPWPSVKSSLNGPLATACKSAHTAISGSPTHLFDWNKRSDGLWEFRIIDPVRTILQQILAAQQQAA